MKKNFISLFALCAFCAATLVACGSDDDDFGVEADEYGKTAKDLESMECTAKKDGMIVYLSEDNKRMVCHGSTTLSGKPATRRPNTPARSRIRLRPMRNCRPAIRLTRRTYTT